MAGPWLASQQALEALSWPLAFLSGCTECRRPGPRKRAAAPVRVWGPSSPGLHTAGSLSPWRAVLCGCGSLGAGVLCPLRPGAASAVGCV